MNFKNTTILAMFFCLLVPFVLLNNFYPFWRFGMFAEPVKSQIQTEQFKIYRSYSSDSSSGIPEYFSPENIGFDENQFLYIARNYYYKSQTTFFLKEVSRLYYQKNPKQKSKLTPKRQTKEEQKSTETWQLYRVVVKQKIQQLSKVQKDSILAATLAL